MALSFFIQKGNVFTGSKLPNARTVAQLFNVTKWLKQALMQLGVPFFDTCAVDNTNTACAAPAYAAAISSWTSTTRPATVATGMIAVGFNTTTSKVEVWNGSAWVGVALS